MNIDASNTVEYDVGEEVERAEAWEGDLATLADLTDTIRSAWHTKDMNVVEVMCRALLAHDNLPPFQRGMFQAYMCEMDGEDPATRLEAARFWLQKAARLVAQAGLIDDRITSWLETVRSIRSRVVIFEDEPTEGATLPTFETTLPSHAMLDGARVVNPGEATAQASMAWKIEEEAALAAEDEAAAKADDEAATKAEE